jgi:hypothetical protein
MITVVGILRKAFHLLAGVSPVLPHRQHDGECGAGVGEAGGPMDEDRLPGPQQWNRFGEDEDRCTSPVGCHDRTQQHVGACRQIAL